MKELDIDLLKYKDLLRLRVSEEKKQVFDIIRKKWIIFNSEEFVRQLFIQFLTRELGYPKGWISVEKGVTVEGIFRRY